MIVTVGDTGADFQHALALRNLFRVFLDS